MPIYNKSQEQYLLDEFNKKNPRAAMPVTALNVVFGKPTPLEDATTAANATVMLRAKQRRGYLGSQLFDYEQLDIDVYFKNINVRVSLPGITKLSQAITHLNGKYGLNLRPGDLEEVTLTPNKKFTIRMSPNCLQFRGSVEAIYKPGPMDLNQLVVNKKLDVLQHPVEVDGRRCAKMLSWGIDFTDDRGLLQSITAGGLSGGVNQQTGRSDELVNLMVSRGFPRWSYLGAKWMVVATTGVADCNKQYDMVAIVSNVDDPGISGDIYLHYNV